MSSLLEEAIVDAKALKDAALKNAENTVLERYSGEVRTALDTLLEQDDFGLGLGEETTPEGDMSFADDVPFAFQNEELDAPAEDELVEIDFHRLKERIAEEEAAGDPPRAEDLMSATEMAPEMGAMGEAPLNEDELDKMASREAGTDEAEVAAGRYVGQEIPAGPGPGREEDEPVTEDDDPEIAITEEMLADLVEELVVDMKAVPQGWASINSADNGIEQANNDAMGAAHAAHLAEEEELEEEESTAPDVTHMVYERKISTLTESTRELRTLLIESKDQLTKLNLENAKLVYQNKALSSTSLNERQKEKIVEAVQSANSVEEATIIFETIQNAVGVSNSKNSSRPQTLREAVQRPISLLLNSNNSNNSKKNNEATRDPNMDRMLRLAGLTKQ